MVCYGSGAIYHLFLLFRYEAFAFKTSTELEMKNDSRGLIPPFPLCIRGRRIIAQNLHIPLKYPKKETRLLHPIRGFPSKFVREENALEEIQRD